MIRHRRGDEFLLFTQNDHALFSGMLAERIGNASFAPLSPLGPSVQGIALHDSGWLGIDDIPSLDGEGLPMHFLHTPAELSMSAWSASVDRAAVVHPWCGLLVSQHVLRLSALPHDAAGAGGTPIDPHLVFAINKFQHRQIEIQEQLRSQLGLRNDLPLTLGLANAGADSDEDQLLTAACWLRATDSLSLDVLCDRALSDTIDYIFPRIGTAPVQLTIGRPAPFVLTVAPWPFDRDRIVAEIPFRRVPAGEFASLDEFRKIYATTLIEKQAVEIFAG
jgi:hypothetical protein